MTVATCHSADNAAANALSDRIRRFAPDRVSALSRLVRTPHDAKTLLETIWSRALMCGQSVYTTPLAAIERLHHAITAYAAGRVDARLDFEGLLADAAAELDALSDVWMRWDRELFAAVRHAAPAVFPLYFATSEDFAARAAAAMPSAVDATSDDGSDGQFAAAPCTDEVAAAFTRSLAASELARDWDLSAAPIRDRRTTGGKTAPTVAHR